MNYNLRLVQEKLLQEIKASIGDKSILNVLRKVPRERFILPNDYCAAYENIPLSIGDGQTISQPLIVCIMIELLELKYTDKVLDVGSGSGYQTALLAELSSNVIGVERIKRLVDSSKNTITRLGYKNVEIYQSQEELGYPKRAPYDAIIVGAAAPKLPLELVNQLSPKGRLVVPVGDRENQQIVKVVKTEQSYHLSTYGNCRFVPLIGKGAWID
ncbi:MAG: protein-L-isoaspartate(D-aspartate) O-methyltransferase [SAR202 cluster bacterium]|nr:protein-L-isoaspartate O-methyltransferase [Chloroflexota bacterium]MQG38546.1 protein-L-isoaspartate(D-aspartate) O-methyltransferase [SAR202 cluster bacterium]|tara:strand:+ start:248 stop:889 length:642 start_codon:yes stop_codon:yes gene_type:complete